VRAQLVVGKKKASLVCQAEMDHFLCQGAKSLAKGTLLIQAKREGTQASMDAKYELPFKPFLKTEGAR